MVAENIAKIKTHMIWKYIFIQSKWFWMILNLIKRIFYYITFFSWIKIYFHLIKINLYSVRNIFIVYNFFFIQVKYIFIIWIFHWILFSWAYLVFHLHLQKVRILLSVCKLNNSKRMWILINSFMMEVPII